MKTIFTLLFTLILSISSYSQYYPLDFFGKSEMYCLNNLESPKIEDINGIKLYITYYQGLYVGYVMSSDRHRCIAILIHYKDKNERLYIIQTLNNIVKSKKHKWHFLTEKLFIPVWVKEDKKSNTFIFQQNDFK